MEEQAAPARWTVRTAPCPKVNKLTEPTNVVPPAFGPRPAFLESSQARHWMFSIDELKAMRADASSHAAAALQTYIGAQPNGSAPTPLLLEEESDILRFYLLRVGKLVKAFHLPALVEATAMSLMKRFYLRNSCTQFHPKLIMYVAGLTQAHEYLLGIKGRECASAAAAFLSPDSEECRPAHQAEQRPAVCGTGRCFRNHHYRSRIRHGPQSQL